MEIRRSFGENAEVLKISGRLDGNTSFELDKELNALIESGTFNITLDISALQYLSSAGLRVLLSTHKRCAKQSGCFSVTGVTKMIQEIFDVTGFAAILNIV